MDMTPELLRDACKKNGGYAQPTLNDQLFLQCRGFNKIANLEPYVNLKVLWLEQNGIANIEGLEGQSKLVSLFLQNNAINQMVGLQSLSNLRILNLSHNYITRIEGLGASCPLLETLQISHNHLASLHACEDLWQLADTLSSVDLSFNKLERDDNAAPTNQAGTHDLTIVNFFKRLPNASVIYLQGNPLSHGLKNYRKNMIVHLPQLTYLDERPVFPDERRATEAWGVGGEKAEADERVKIRQEKKEELSSCVQTMARAMEANRETRDRLTKQWDEKRELEREELKVRRSAFKKQVQTLDSEEYEVRGAVEVQEDDAWEDLRYDMDRLYDALMVTEHKYQKAAKEAAELDRIKQQVESELKEQEEQIAELLERAAAIAPPVVPPVAIAAAALEVDEEVVELPAGKAARHVDPTAGSLNAASSAAATAASSRIAAAKAQDSLNYWIKQLDQNDDEVLAQMEEDLQGFLLELEPGLPVVRSATTTTTAPSNTNNQSGKPKQSSAALLPVASNKQLHKMQRAVTEAVAVTAASLREGEAAVTGGVKKSREALWESFYAWETRNSSRTAK